MLPGKLPNRNKRIDHLVFSSFLTPIERTIYVVVVVVEKRFTSSRTSAFCSLFLGGTKWGKGKCI